MSPVTAKIDIYTKRYCSYCQRAKELLRIKGVNFVEHDITDARPETAEIKRQAWQRAVPEIFINNVSVGSCHELFELDESGKLDALLELTATPSESYQ